MTREQAIAKVVKLAEITEERGASPAEEETATRMAHRLIERFALTLPEVEAVARAEAERRRPTPRAQPMPPMWPPGAVPWYGPTTGTTNNPFFGVRVHVVFGP